MTDDTLRQAIMESHAAPISGAYRGPTPTALPEASWRRDTADAVFFHRALERIVKERLGEDPEEAAGEAMFQEIFFALQRGDLQSIALSPQGLGVPIWPGQWRVEEHIGQVLVTGLYEQPVSALSNRVTRSWVFVLRTSLDQYLAAPQPDEQASWTPGPDETLKDWCAKSIPPVEALARSKKAANPNPSEAQICRVLAVMWGECKGEPANWETIQQYRNTNRQAEKR